MLFKNVDPRILKLKNCERVGREAAQIGMVRSIHTHRQGFLSLFTSSYDLLRIKFMALYMRNKKIMPFFQV